MSHRGELGGLDNEPSLVDDDERIVIAASSRVSVSPYRDRKIGNGRILPVFVVEHYHINEFPYPARALFGQCGPYFTSKAILEAGITFSAAPANHEAAPEQSAAELPLLKPDFVRTLSSSLSEIKRPTARLASVIQLWRGLRSPRMTLDFLPRGNPMQDVFPFRRYRKPCLHAVRSAPVDERLLLSAIAMARTWTSDQGKGSMVDMA